MGWRTRVGRCAVSCARAGPRPVHAPLATADPRARAVARCRPRNGPAPPGALRGVRRGRQDLPVDGVRVGRIDGTRDQRSLWRRPRRVPRDAGRVAGRNPSRIRPPDGASKPADRVKRPGRLVLLGHPVRHSLSPRFQNAALKAAGIELTYEALDVPPAELTHRLAELKLARAAGNVTVPH